MKIKVLFFLFVFTLLLTINTDVFAKPKMQLDVISSMNSNLEARIKRVENGLLSQSKDEPSDIKYNLNERMDFYKVPGVSIAVINNGKIEWAQGYGVKRT